jgi:hypothetical protein
MGTMNSRKPLEMMYTWSAYSRKKARLRSMDADTRVRRCSTSGSQVAPVGVQQGNAAFERLGEGDFAVHAQVGDPLDFGHDLPAARVALQGNVGQLFHRLYLGKVLSKSMMK